nr:MAG TPA: hypothetical protein [Caudoviricetes sp.]
MSFNVPIILMININVTIAFNLLSRNREFRKMEC